MLALCDDAADDANDAERGDGEEEDEGKGHSGNSSETLES